MSDVLEKIELCFTGLNYHKNADDVMKCVNSMDRDEREKIFKWLEGRIEPYALVLLGWFYQRGYCSSGEKTFAKAMELYLLGESGGNTTGMYLIGTLYEDGLGVKADYLEAKKWYLKSAEAGDPEGMIAMGLMLMKGSEPHVTEALNWHLKAVEIGCTSAMFHIGVIYHFSEIDSVKDYKKAMIWYVNAYNSGDSFVMNNIGLLYNGGCGVDKDLNIALKWFLGAATGKSFLNAADIYEEQNNYLKAMECVMKGYKLLTKEEEKKSCITRMNKIFRRCNVELLQNWLYEKKEYSVY
ncbi:MAG: hypothetical protein Harvfovirus67_7 [Harvfovirus sp.]|uniref:Sel1 repeat family protein n=1 Tax=Harvfovirus sp. TaxID=2487768 RepID=A0A3G5A3Q4_9VIRU|nr:MAG: hypothetical protein Harvfovirus67_7 [Harvfovirus sp.]